MMLMMMMLCAGLKVGELTGDMQLSKKELAETQMIVTTPEKWDVITRKGGDVSVAATVRLLIIDEVGLIHCTHCSDLSLTIALSSSTTCHMSCASAFMQNSFHTVTIVSAH